MWFSAPEGGSGLYLIPNLGTLIKLRQASSLNPGESRSNAFILVSQAFEEICVWGDQPDVHQEVVVLGPRKQKAPDGPVWAPDVCVHLGSCHFQ